MSGKSTIKKTGEPWFPYPEGISNDDANGISDHSDLSLLDAAAYDHDPIVLFKSWYEEAKQSGVLEPHAGCLATASGDGQEVMARFLLLRKVDIDNGFVTVTDKRSTKCKHLNSKQPHEMRIIRMLRIMRCSTPFRPTGSDRGWSSEPHPPKAENPNATYVFLWCYRRDDNVEVNRQARISGTMTEMEESEYTKLYNVQPVYCKVRAHLCHQGKKIEDWSGLKRKHDSLYNDIKNGKDLAMPDHFTAYKLHPKTLEFYDTVEYQIADRAKFTLKDDGSWLYERLAA